MEAGSLNIAVGLDTEELAPVYINLKETPHFLVAGKVKTGKTTTLKSIMTALTKGFSPAEVEFYLADSFSMGLYNIRKSPYIKAYSGSQPQLVDLVDKLFEKVDVQRSALASARTESDDNEQFDDSRILENFPRLVLVVDDFNDFMQMAEQEVKDKLEKLLSRERNIKFHLFAAGMTGDIGGNYDQLAKTIREFQSGLLFDDAMEQQVFNLRVSYSQANVSMQLGEGYLINRGQFVKAKIASI
jgi:DNA segregation ATPase FtsK/SpoIIIE, S-DNA-T family